MSRSAGQLDATETVVAMEQAALERWCSGDPSGFLEICGPDVTYFDPFSEHRLDGLSALTDYYEGLRGQIRAPQHEVLEPVVQHVGEAAVLTFQFRSCGDDGTEQRWNCTEVYEQAGNGWRIASTHWSFTNAGSAG